MSSPQKTRNDLGAVADALRSHDRFLLVTHEMDIAHYGTRIVSFRDGRVRTDQAVLEQRTA